MIKYIIRKWILNQINNLLSKYETNLELIDRLVELVNTNRNIIDDIVVNEFENIFNDLGMP